MRAGRQHAQRLRLPGPRASRASAATTSSSSTSAAAARRPTSLLERDADCARPGPGRPRLRRADADRRRRAVPARATAAGRADHGLDRRQRRHRVRARGRPDPVRRRGGAGRSRRTSPRSPSACARRPASKVADRRHHLPGRDPRPVGRRRTRPGPRAALRRRVQASFINPALKRGLRGAPAAGFVDVTAATGAYGSLEETIDRAPGVRQPIPVPVAQASASSPTTASSATSTRARTATG